MAGNSFSIDMDLTQFSSGLQSLMSGYGDAVAKGMRSTTRSARDAVRAQTSARFDLSTAYILKGIKNTPETSAQMRAGANAMQRYGDIRGRVYLRPGNGKRSLQFMVAHETGGLKEVDGKASTIPARDLMSKSYKTARGAVRKRWKPKQLLTAYNAAGGRNAPRGNTVGKKPFIKKSPMSGALQIVRRKSKRNPELEILYTFKRNVRLKKRWGFVHTARLRGGAVANAAFERALNQWVASA